MNAKSWRDCGGGRTPSHLYVLKTLDIERTFFQFGADLNDYLMRASIPDLLHRSSCAALQRAAIATASLCYFRPLSIPSVIHFARYL